MPTIVIYVGGVAPAHNGFFCDDTSLRYPYMEKDSVPLSTVVAVGVSAVILTVCSGLFLCNSHIELTRDDLWLF